MKEYININDWDRKPQFQFFSNFTNPYASVTSVISVDNIVRYAKENHISFYGIMSYNVLKTINEIDEFKYVLDNGQVYKTDKINMTFSALKKNNQLNFSRTVEYTEFEEFISKFTEAKAEAESDNKIPFTNESNKIYLTCTPWMRFTSVENPMNYNKIDSIPRICWGKYFLDNNEYNIDLSIQVNHAFQDGYHLGIFFEQLQKNINEFKRKKNEKGYNLHRSR